MNVTFRPLPLWPYPEQAHRPALFKATYQKTLQDLEYEIDRLRGSEVIIGIVTEGSMIRLDGRPYERMRTHHAGVEVSFEVPDGRRLVFHTDVHSGFTNSWQDNLRAIALGLESLRAVDRYGITGTGEQYAGFLKLGTSAADPARGRLLVEEAGGLRPAIKRWHPDNPDGDRRAFDDVQAYRQLTGGGS